MGNYLLTFAGGRVDTVDRFLPLETLVTVEFPSRPPLVTQALLLDYFFLGSFPGPLLHAFFSLPSSPVQSPLSLNAL